MQESRTKNSLYNIITALLEYAVKILLVFFTRTIFIQKLGTDYLGLDGFFTNILSILNITELGLSSAIIFGLYKPLANNDTNKINILMHIYKKCYIFIGFIISVVGLILLPFLPYIIDSSYNFGNIYLFFILYILQILSTYWVLAYKEGILIADQKKYKTTIVTNLCFIFKFILQLLSLFIFESYELYIVSSIIYNIARNIGIAFITNKNYPYIKKYNGEKLEKEEKNNLIKNVFGMSLYKISSTVMNSTDNIIISTFIGLTTTGIYSNYLLIVSNFNMVISTLFNAVTASVGNLFAEGNKKRSEFIFRCLNFLNFWIYGFVAICFWELLNPFIELWLGNEYIFEKIIVLAITMNFITDGLQRAVIIYKDACGLFWKGKLRPVFSALTNIVISIILVKFCGILGVILGSIISRMITTWWFDPYLVYNNAFEMSPKKYFFRYFRSLIIIIGTAALIDLFTNFIVADIIVIFIVKVFLCIIIPNLLFWIIFRKSEEYNYLKSIIVNKIKNIKENIKKKNRG